MIKLPAAHVLRQDVRQSQAACRDHILRPSSESHAQMPDKERVDVILTKEDGTQIVYHTNRRDALHQMFLSVGVLSTDR